MTDRKIAKGMRGFLSTVSIVALTVAAAAQAQGKPVEYNIGAQQLSEALNQFAVQSDLQLMFQPGQVSNLSTDGIKGELLPEAAIQELLDGSDLEYEFATDGILVVREKAIDSSAADGLASVQLAQLDGDNGNATDTDDASDNEDKPAPNIVVTGTNIRGVAPDSSPSYVFDREDIDKTGFGTLSEFVQSLPQSFSGGSNPAIGSRTGLPNDRAAGFNTSFGASANLRGLGSGSTLVLLNGTRLAPAGNIGDFVDISMIPLSAIERVEVLTDGASAIYGADAIAGVINFVLRDDFEGAETFARFGTVTEGGLQEYRAGQTLGTSWETGNALVSYEFFHRDNLMVDDKDFSSAVPVPNDLLARQQSHNVLVAGAQELGERVTLRGHFGFTQRDARNEFTDFFGTSVSDIDSKQYGGYAGAEIEIFGDWLLDVSGGYNKLSSFIDVQGPFGDQIDTDSDLWSVDAKVDGTVFELPGGDVKLATGISYREESFANGFGSIGIITSEDRNVLSVFGEAFLPIVGSDNRLPGVERLELTAAGRYDDYSDFGDTLNPKVGLLWSPFDGLNFRGTYSTSFNPPNLADIGTVDNGAAFTFFVSDPASMTGVSLALIDSRTNRNLGPETSTAWTAGFDSQWDVGPGSLDLSATWFDIRFKDRIAQGGNVFAFLNDPEVFAGVIIVDPDPSVAMAIISEASLFLPFDGGVWMMPGDEEFVLDSRLLNLAGIDTTGLDVNVSYSVDCDNIGQLSFALNTSYLFSQERQITPTAPAVDAVSTIFSPADLRFRGNVSWSNNGWDAGVFVNYVDDYVDNRNLLGTGDVRVDSWTTVDLNLSYNTGERSSASFLNNTKFSLSILNVFNQEPPSVAINAFGSEFGYDPTNASPLGRFISFQVTKGW